MAAYIVSSGQTSTGIILNIGDTETVLSGGVASSTVINTGGSETISVGGSAYLDIVNSGGSLAVSSGGVAVSATINSGGVLTVSSGNPALAGSINAAVNGGTLTVLAGAMAANTTINANGNETIFGASFADLVNENGSLTVSSGGSAAMATVNSGGTLTVGFSGSVGSVTISNGGTETVLSGGVAGRDTVFGSEVVLAGGVEIFGAVSSGGSLTVSSGGSASTTVILNGGLLTVSSGGSTSSGILKSGGSETILAGGSASFDEISAGGVETVFVGGLAESDFIHSGGSLVVSMGGMAETTKVDSSGSITVLAGGSASNETIFRGGTETVLGYVSNETIFGSALVLSGGSTSNNTISSLGLETVVGTASFETVLGSVSVSAGGLEYSATISGGGLLALSSGGTASATQLLNGGTLELLDGASNLGLNWSAGTVALASGYILNAQSVGSNQKLAILASGVADMTIVSGGGIETVSSGGTDLSSKILSGGSLTVSSSGSATNDAIFGGGLETVAPGGTTISAVISGSGTLNLLIGGLASGGITFADSGGQLQIHGGTMPPALMFGFDPDDTILLANVPFSVGGSAVMSAGNVLTVTEGGHAYQLQFDPAQDFSHERFLLDSQSGGTKLSVTSNGATVRWIAGTGNWSSGADWNTGSPPASGDVALITDGGDVKVTTPIAVGEIIVSSTQSYPTCGLDIENVVAGVRVYGDLLDQSEVLIDYNSNAGGSALTLDGTLLNSVGGFLNIGNTKLSSNTTVSANALANSGSVNLTGGLSSASVTFNANTLSNSGNILLSGGVGASTSKVVLNIASAAPSTLMGGYGLSGQSAIQFSTGSIISIAKGSALTLDGPNAVMATTFNPTTNSALTFLGSNAGTFGLSSGASVTLFGNFDNSGTFNLDASKGNSSLTINGTLSNSGIVNLLYHGSPTIHANGLSNTGSLYLDGNFYVNSVAPSSWTGAVALDGTGVLQFSSGDIEDIASGGRIQVSSNQQFLAVASDPTSNSALTNLKSNEGQLELSLGVIKTNAGVDFSNSGSVAVAGGAGAPEILLSIGGTITNTGSIDVYGLSTLQAPALVNSGTLSVRGGTFTNMGTAIVAGMVNNVGTIAVTSFGELEINGPVIGSGTISTGQWGSILELSSSVASSQTIALQLTTGFPSGTLKLDDPQDFHGTISGLLVGSPSHNSIDLTTVALQDIASGSFDAATDLMTVDTISHGTISIQLAGSYAAGTYVNWTQDAGGAGADLFLNSVPCFCRGTMIRTNRGEIAVEELAVGDRVETLSGSFKPIVWIGMGRDLVTRAHRLARPIIVRHSALADGVPSRDLYLTHGHALYLDDVLIPVEHLINYRSILWDDTARVVEYYHIELTDHDVVWANDAPAETYYDASNRALFQNVRAGSVASEAKPRFAPVETASPIVEDAWVKLYERAKGHIELPITEDADLHVVISGQRRDAVSVRDGVYVFKIHGIPETGLTLQSRRGVPSLLGLNRHEHRQLGVAIRQIVVSGRGGMLSLDSQAPALIEAGCHPPENGFCWTDGMLSLPSALFAAFRGPITLIIQTSNQGMRYSLTNLDTSRRNRLSADGSRASYLQKKHGSRQWANRKVM